MSSSKSHTKNQLLYRYHFLDGVLWKDEYHFVGGTAHREGMKLWGLQKKNSFPNKKMIVLAMQ